MTPLKSITLRCYAKKEGNQWVAVCIDLSLAAQADSLAAAKEKLESMITTYVSEARGIHQAYAEQLLSRKAPISQRIFYGWLKVMSGFMALMKRTQRDSALVFSEPFQPKSV